MHNPAATMANQKGYWNPADKRTLMVTLDVKACGNVTVVDPIKGTAIPTTACRMNVTSNNPATKKINVYKGFL